MKTDATALCPNHHWTFASFTPAYAEYDLVRLTGIARLFRM